MKRHTKIVWVFFAVIAGLSILGAVGNPVKLSAQDVRQQKDKKSDAPVLDYEAEIRKAVSTERKGKSASFNGRGNYSSKIRIAELPQGAEILPTNSHWWIDLSALPVSQSDVVVLGEVVDAEAHLSDDRTGIYSEFSIQVSDVFKDTAGLLSAGSTISANRIGGGVKFASGKIQEYRFRRQGMPLKGNRYVLFLKREESGDFTILTGYKLSNGRVAPLDGEDSDDPRAALPFARYKGADESQLLQDLWVAVQRGDK